VSGAALHRLAFLALIGLMLAIGPVACGKKGDPVLPNGAKDQYPQSYPGSSDEQTGVFSN
jgi:predicted small lipoprotein YifL